MRRQRVTGKEKDGGSVSGVVAVQACGLIRSGASGILLRWLWRVMVVIRAIEEGRQTTRWCTKVAAMGGERRDNGGGSWR